MLDSDSMTLTQRWPEQGWAFFQLLLVASFSHAREPVCRPIGEIEKPQISKEGDVMLGAILSFHSSWINRLDNYTQKPPRLQCTSLNLMDFQFAQSLLFAIEEINNSLDILPGISLGYKMYDACGSIGGAVKGALALVNGNEEVFASSETQCTTKAQVQAILGETSSSPCMAIATVLGPFYLPLISHFATCACLSDKVRFPSFFRTIPSDLYQSRALAQLVRHFGWTWVGAIRTNDDYGNNGMATFTETAQELGICLEYSVSFFRTDPPEKILNIVNIIKKASSRVIVAFMSYMDMKIIIKMLSDNNATGYQWVGSESWILDSQTAKLDKQHILDGAIGLSIPEAHVSGMKEFMMDVKPLNTSGNQLFSEFWEELFSCKFNAESSQKQCTGTESLTGVSNSFTDMSLMPIFNNVYKGVYAVAHALHKILKCNRTCQTDVELSPHMILQHLKNIHFQTKEGEDVYFNENGDPAAKYEIINWQPTVQGTVDFVTVGLYDASLPANQQLKLQKTSITWTQNSKQASNLILCMMQVPVSVCSKTCSPGTRKVLQKGKPVCCYDCVLCAEGEMSNTTDSVTCFQCPPDFWPNAQRDTCVKKETEFLSYDEIMGVLLTVASLFGTSITCTVAWIFFKYRKTPIVRANNSELSFLLLFSLTLCFLCSLTFIGRPSEWSCMLRHTAFGITFVLCISCVLGKTIVVLMAFRATLPGSNVMKWFGPLQQRLSISHFATCACLTNRKMYPTFYRTIPSDYYQSKAVAKLIKHFGWTWIGVIAVNNYYGLNGVASFVQTAQEDEICIEYSEAFSSSDPPEYVKKIVEVIKQATSRVILAFMSHREIKILAAELYLQNVTGIQWVGSDAWITDYSLTDSDGHSILVGSLGFVVGQTHIPRLEDHLRRLHPSQFPNSQFVRDFWESVFDCSLDNSSNANRKLCTGTESLQNVDIDFTDVSELRFENNVYKSLYAVAHALDDLLKCEEGKGPFANGSCANKTNIQLSQVLHYLDHVDFITRDGQRVYFDSNGDSPARYELVNLQTTDKGTLEPVTVGIFDASFPESKQFIMNKKSLVWSNNSLLVPVSVCSASCNPGTHKVLIKGKPVCCYDCIRCPAGEITNTTDALECRKCPSEFWSNEQRDTCVPKVVEFLSYTELLGYLLVLFALIGWFLTLITTLIFYCHKETPLVRANNSELSFLLLFSLTLCFLCSLTFIGRPSEWSCMLRHTAFGITFVLCISCVLGKTIVVLMAFRATLPGSNVMKWFGPLQQRLIVFGATLIQLVHRGSCVCQPLGQIQPAELSQTGDVLLGGIFTFRTAYDGSVPTYTIEPPVPTCLNLNEREFKFAQTMIFAIDEINKNPDLLPHHTIGYKIYNACGMSNIVQSALVLTNGQEEFLNETLCSGHDNAVAVLGHSGSEPTIAFARIIGRFHVPVISHFATCACLSDRDEFPSFFRTIPSDRHQSRVLAKLLKHFGWTWVGTISNLNAYGINGINVFIQAAQQEGVCIEYYEAFEQTGPASAVAKVVETVKRSSSKVIVAFMSHREVKVLAAELYKNNITGLQWVGMFLDYRHTPIVRANNSELSFLLLFSLTLCFLCSLTFIGRPSEWSCMLRHTAFGITFVLCISCVLGKTIVVLMAFRATLPGSNVMKWSPYMIVDKYKRNNTIEKHVSKNHQKLLCFKSGINIEIEKFRDVCAFALDPQVKNLMPYSFSVIGNDNIMAKMQPSIQCPFAFSNICDCYKEHIYALNTAIFNAQITPVFCKIQQGVYGKWNKKTMIRDLGLGYVLRQVGSGPVTLAHRLRRGNSLSPVQSEARRENEPLRAFMVVWTGEHGNNPHSSWYEVEFCVQYLAPQLQLELT
ncbi:hypothetical protein WMY93_017815 [Mugilogobius chulae]|uniref:G-protein coupled receptors family 3 profile domain-containing protein n=1 Tax=Mugilogobius chulae TaxID=88201 RepID=A0AAW0NS17_9GOBI